MEDQTTYHLVLTYVTDEDRETNIRSHKWEAEMTVNGQTTLHYADDKLTAAYHAIEATIGQESNDDD